MIFTAPLLISLPLNMVKVETDIDEYNLKGLREEPENFL
jgi:hypothetical protein